MFLTFCIPYGGKAFLSFSPTVVQRRGGILMRPLFLGVGGGELLLTETFRGFEGGTDPSTE